MLTGAGLASALSATDATSTVPAQTNPSPPIVAIRAKEQVGSEVFSSDGVRVGTVGDYVFQFGKLPQLRYVIVKSGGFLGLHADQRAIPADAITLTDHRIHVSLTSADYSHLPVMPFNHRAFLSDQENLTNMAKLCGTPAAHARLNASYVLFSDLGFLSSVADRTGRDLGHFSDIWIDFNANEAPYLELDPTGGDLDSFGNIDYMIPTTEIARVQEGQIRLGAGEAEFENLKWVDNASAVVAAAGEKLESAQAQSGE